MQAVSHRHIFSLFACLDNFLLAVMSYDPFVAIYHPMNYTVVMKSQFCGLLVVLSLVISDPNSLLQSFMLMQLFSCMDMEIPHFFCELNQVLHLAFSDTFLNNTVRNLTVWLLGDCPFIGILYSYSKIVSSICAVSSTQGKYKAFSTCVSHLYVVLLFYCTGMGVYLNFTVTQNTQNWNCLSDVHHDHHPPAGPLHLHSEE
jgi:olfactory receptor